MRALSIPYLTNSGEHFVRLSKIAATMRMELHPLDSVESLELWLKSHDVTALITDSDVEDGCWRHALELCKLLAPEARVLVTAHTDSASLWAEVAEAGAYDLLAQPFYAPEVRRCLGALMESQNKEQLAEATL